MTDDSIGDELHRLSEEFRKLVGKSTDFTLEKTSPTELSKYGLTLDEAKTWLEYEPNYKPADEKKQSHRTDEDETEPPSSLYDSNMHGTL
jgi:hypothetical protein